VRTCLGVVCLGVVWRGVFWRGVFWRGVFWRGVFWRGVFWRGVAGVVVGVAVLRGVAPRLTAGDADADILRPARDALCCIGSSCVALCIRACCVATRRRLNCNAAQRAATQGVRSARPPVRQRGWCTPQPTDATWRPWKHASGPRQPCITSAAHTHSCNGAPVAAEAAAALVRVAAAAGTAPQTLSPNIRSYPILSDLIRSHPISFDPILSDLIRSYSILSHPIRSYPILSEVCGTVAYMWRGIAGCCMRRSMLHAVLH
jgi:hypothetical protein